MREWLRGLSYRTEFAIVMVAAFGLALAGTIQMLLSPEWWSNPQRTFTNAGLLLNLIFEVGVGLLLGAFLSLRGWSGAQVGLSPARPWSRALLTTPLVALGLLLASYAGYWLLAFAAFHVSPYLLWGAPRAAPHLPLVTVLAVALVNAPFEELFECGYVISSLRERLGVTRAVNISAGLRVALHLYQGPIGVLSITPFALIAAYWFARTKRLAPLIVAHGMQDFIGLALSSWH
jgi:uncharacterized protein